MEIRHRITVSLFSLSTVLVCALGSFIVVESAAPSDSPNKYSTFILQSSNDQNFTLSSETNADLKGANNHENVSWQIREFQVANISTLLTNYKSLSLPQFNDSRFFTSEKSSSLTVIVKNFSGFLLYLNFSYYIGTKDELTQTPTASLPAPLPLSSASADVNERSHNRPNNDEESKKLAMAIVAEPVTKLLTKSIVNAMTQNLLLATKQQQQGNQQLPTPTTSTTPKSEIQLDNESSQPPNLVCSTSSPNATINIEPTILKAEDAQNATSNNTIILMQSSSPTNENSQNFTKSETTQEEELSSKPITVVDDPVNLFPSTPSPATTEKTEAFLTSESSIENVSLSFDNNATEVTTTTPVPEPQPEPPGPGPKTMTQDVARKKRSINPDDPEVNDATNKPKIENTNISDTGEAHKDLGINQAVALNAEKSSQTSDDSMSTLPIHLDTIIKTAAAVVAAAATSNQITKTGTTISEAHMADIPNINSGADEKESLNTGGAPIKETDSTSSSSSSPSSGTAAKAESSIINKKAHSHHHEHHRHERRKNKKEENGVIGVNEEGDSSSSSEEDVEHGGEGVKKISYKTWRASLEKRNRPPGLFVTVNDNIIFDNWEGIWNKPQVLGKWTGSLKTASKAKWNQTYISTIWEEATEHDVKITFEWEPMHENAFVIISDILLSTVSIPLPLCNDPDSKKGNDDDKKVEPTNNSEQNEPSKPNATIETKLNETFAANVVEHDSSDTLNMKEHVEGRERERQVLKIMRKIGNDDIEAERLAHEVMKNLTAKESDDVSLESTLRKLPYNIKEALLLHAQRVLSEGLNVSTSTTNPSISSTLASSTMPSTATVSSSTETTVTSTSETTHSTTISPETLSSIFTSPETTSTNPPTTSTTASTTPSTIPSTTPSTTHSTTPSTTSSTTSSTTVSTTKSSTGRPTTITEFESSTTNPATASGPSTETSTLILRGEAKTVFTSPNNRPERKMDGVTAIAVLALTFILLMGILGFLIWRKVQIETKGRNAAR